MGIFHCVTSDCAEVRYQPYKKRRGIRYRYPGQDWITVDGDDYEVKDQRQGQCTGNIRYIIQFSALEIAWETGVIQRKSNAVWLSPYTKIAEPDNPLYFDDFYEGNRPILFGQPFHVRVDEIFPSGIRDQSPLWAIPRGPNTYFMNGSIEDINIIMLHWEGVYNNYPLPPESDNCGNCDLTIYKDGTIIYQESRQECPEVEVITGECELSDRTSVIKIEKFPFLERVEVTDFDYQNFGANVFRLPIPDNCLVVRKNNIAAIPPLPGGVPTPSNSALGQDFTYGFIQQICSDEGCPPPEYEVICNCDSEECPPGTCPVECGNSVCCYDPNTGIAVDEIAIENYRGGGS